MSPEFLEKIKKKAAESHRRLDDYDNFCADDVGGGNQDDAFNSGMECGEIWAARELLAELEKTK